LYENQKLTYNFHRNPNPLSFWFQYSYSKHLNFLEKWKAVKNQRNFFDLFARSKNFNPLEAENWYSVTLKEIMKAGGRGLLNIYNGSHIKALMQLYPELTLEKRNFWKSESGWKVPRIQRNFFDEFARSKKFSPLDANNWYSVTLSEVITAGGGSLLQYYNGSHIKALVTLYPELMLKKRNFLKSKKGSEIPKNQFFFSIHHEL